MPKTKQLDGLNPIESKHISGLKAQLNLNEAFIWLDDELLCTMDTRSQGVRIGDKLIDMRFGKDEDLEHRVAKTIKTLEKYFESDEGINKRFNGSRLLDYIGKEFTENRVASYYNSVNIISVVQIDDKNLLNELFTRSNMQDKTHSTFEQAIISHYRKEAVIIAPRLTKKPTLTFNLYNISSPGTAISKTVKLTDKEQKAIAKYLSTYEKAKKIHKTYETAQSSTKTGNSDSIKSKRIPKPTR